MIFEEALALLRQGKKIRNPIFGDDEYLMACRVGMIFDMITPQELEEKPISIVKMKGDKQHPDMRPKYIFPQNKCSIDPWIHNYPQLDLFSIMRNDWEVIE